MKLSKNILPLSFPLLIFILLFIFFAFNYSPTIKALTIDDIRARVNVAVCGDNKAEGSEDCDNNDLNHKTCKNLGFAGGDLSCSIACEYDTSACISPTPTLTPTPTPIPTNAPETETIQQTTTSEKEKNKEENRERKSLIDLIISSVPNNVSVFDVNQDDKITYSDIPDSIQKWVDSWTNAKEIVVFDTELQKPALPGKLSCDINNDGICNLVDFSILLYYIER